MLCDNTCLCTSTDVYHIQLYSYECKFDYCKYYFMRLFFCAVLHNEYVSENIDL